MKNVVVVGSQWGDEGKGKIVDWLSDQADIVIRFQGGHLKSKKMTDILVNKKEIMLFYNKKFITKNTHGTGCTLSSAIATYLSRGKVLKKACELGIKYVNQAIGSNLNYGKGNGPINHLNSIIINKKFR